MAVVADSGAIYALYDAGDRHHKSVVRALRSERGPVILPSAILSEVDYLLREFLGVDAELDFIYGILSGEYALEPTTPNDIRRARDIIATYRDLDIGLADAAVAATADRLRIRTILTIDQRDFRVMLDHSGKPFRLLPADSGK